MKSFLTLLALSITIVTTAQKKDSIYFESTEDTVWTNGKKRIEVTHIDWKCTYHQPHVDKNGRIDRLWISDAGVEWYRYTKRFIMTDTGWKKL